MSTKRRKFTREFKLAAVNRLQSGCPAGRVDLELDVISNHLHAWRRQFEERPNSSYCGVGPPSQEGAAVAELERNLGQWALEIDFEGLLATDRGTAKVAGRDTHTALCRKIHEERQRKGPLTIQQTIALAGVRRAAFYRFEAEVTLAVRDVDLRDAIQRIAM